MKGGALDLELVFREGELSEPVRSWPAEAAEGGVRGREPEPEPERFLDGQVSGVDHG